MTKRLMARELVGIGKRIQLQLNRHEMTERDLAKRMGVGVSTISRYVSGLRIPNATNIIAMCQIFDVSADWLLGITSLPRMYSF